MALINRIPIKAGIMKIKVTQQNAEKIEAALLAVNGKATSFTITSFNEVNNIAWRWLNSMSVDGLLVSERSGAALYFVPAGPTARAYRHQAISTRLAFLVGANGKDVFLVGISPAGVYPRQAEQWRPTIRKSACDRWLARMSDKYGTSL